MIKIENTETYGWKVAIRGMRNPMNSWGESDSRPGIEDNPIWIGAKDKALMKKLADAGSDHRKYLRMITVTADVTAPLYWWKEYDTYKVGTVSNSCSTMHKIHAKAFTLKDFSTEHLTGKSIAALEKVLDVMNQEREHFLASNDRDCWWQMIQLLPSSYNQKRTVMMNYEVLLNIYQQRRFHKLDEWRDLCKWIENLPFIELITG